MANLTALLANDSYIVVQRDIAKAFGLEAAVILGELCQRQCQHGPWFFATNEKLEDSTGLSSHLIRKAVSALKEAGIVDVKAKGIPRKNHYIVSEDALMAFFSSLEANAVKSQSSTTLTTSDESREPHINNDTSNDINNEREGGKRKRFTPPTLEEVAGYCEERGNGIDPERFIDYYESNGWMVGKNRMKDWKAAVRTWERRDGGKPSPSKPKPGRGRRMTIEELLRLPFFKTEEEAQAVLDEDGQEAYTAFWVRNDWGHRLDNGGN